MQVGTLCFLFLNSYHVCNLGTSLFACYRCDFSDLFSVEPNIVDLRIISFFLYGEGIWKLRFGAESILHCLHYGKYNHCHCTLTAARARARSAWSSWSNQAFNIGICFLTTNADICKFAILKTEKVQLFWFSVTLFSFLPLV